MDERTPEALMRRAIELARRGFPSPNPRVGCVIARGGSIVGEGHHDFAGGPHAEAVALARAGANARGADAYVTLEPCNHTGRTGPCTAALRHAGIARVFYAVADPNAKAAGGAVVLAGAGIRVEQGLLASEAEDVNFRWLSAMRRQRPFVAVKAAISLDGRVALPSGASQWITGESARAAGQRLRAEMGAVLVGRGTVEADDPRLTVRIRGVKNQPLRIVLDPSGRLSPNAKVFSEPGTTVRVTAPHVKAGAAGWACPMAGAEFDLPCLLEELWARGQTALLVEGGPRTISAFLRARLVDELHLFLAPKLLGEGPAWAQGLGVSALPPDGEWALAGSRKMGSDVYLRYRAVPRI